VCRVQFDKQQLAVELVPDIHLAAINPAENLPKAIGFAQTSRMTTGICGPYSTVAPPSEEPRTPKQEQHTSGPLAAETPDAAVDEAVAASTVVGALDKMEVLLTELRHMHREALVLRSSTPPVEPGPTFCAAYARIVLELRAVSDEKLAPHLAQLRRLGSGARSASLVSRAAEIGVALREVGVNPPGALEGAEVGEGCLKEAEAMLMRMVNGEQELKLLPEVVGQLGEGQPLRRLVTGCLSLVMAVERFSEAPVSTEVMEGAVDGALASIAPHCAANVHLHDTIRETLARLKAQLRSA
jgi:hypothetical protein